jgi:WD40 repeat protein
MSKRKLIRTGIALYARWFVTNTLSWMLGMLCIYVVIILLLAPLNPPWTYDYYGRYRWTLEMSIVIVGFIHVIIAAIAGGVGGYIYGNFQHAFLKCHFKSIPGWKKTSILSWSLGCAIVAAISWIFASLSPRPDMYGDFYPSDPIGSFSLLEWLSGMTAGAALGTILACFAQRSLLHTTMLSLVDKPYAIRRDWRIAVILGAILGLFFEFLFICFVGLPFPNQLLRSMPWLYLLSSTLIPGAVLGIICGIALSRAFVKSGNVDKPSPFRSLHRLVGFSALTLIGIATFGTIQLGLQTCGWLDRSLGLSGCERVLKGEADAEEISFSLDGRSLTSLPIIWEELKLWEVSTGKPIHQYEISDVATPRLSNNGEFLATGGFHSPIRLWQLPAGDPLRTLYDPHRDSFGPVNHLAFSQDDQLLASARGDKGMDIVQVWRVSDGTLLGEFKAITPLNLTFLPDAASLLIGTSDGTVWQWDPPYDQPQILLEGLGHVFATDFTPNGAFVALLSVYDGIQVWRIADGVKLWSKDVDYQRCLDISPDGTLIATSTQIDVPKYEYPIYIWKLEDGSIQEEFSGQCDVAFSPDSSLLASQGNDFGQIRLWRIENDRE